LEINQGYTTRTMHCQPIIKMSKLFVVLVKWCL